MPVRRAAGDPALPTRRRQLLLSAPFVFGCAFRSVFPRADVQRICVVDSWLSSVAVGPHGRDDRRALLRRAVRAAAARPRARDAHSRSRSAISRVMVPLIVMAETFSWYSVITTNYIGNTMEESTWATVAMLLIVGPGDACGRGCRGRCARSSARRSGSSPATSCSCHDRRADVLQPLARRHGGGRRTTLPFADGIRDAATRWVVTMRIEDWRWEMLWMSLYFSFGVWISVSLIRAPYPLRRTVRLTP